MAYISESRKIDLELALASIKDSLAKIQAKDSLKSPIRTHLLNIKEMLSSLPENESCPTCGFQKESLCLECDNVFSD